MDLDKNKTMETNDKITDELIAKYVSGKATEEEESIVHEHLARNPEFANDLLDIATALRHQHKQVKGKGDQQQTQEAKRVQFVSRRIFYAIAASIVILIGFGLLVFKPFAKSDMEEPLVVENQTQTTSTEPCEGGEEIVSDTMSVIFNEPENPLLAEKQQEVPSQKTENMAKPQHEEPLLADNTPKDSPLEQTDYDDGASMIASLTGSEDNENAPQIKEVVFITDSIPTICNPEKDLVLKWNCNAPSLKLELSSDGVTWKTLNNNIANQNSRTLNSNLLKDYELSNPNYFYWRMTAKYSDGNQTRKGKIVFSRVNN